MDRFTIRRETEADISVIREVTGKAFTGLSLRGYSEQAIVEALRDADALTLSLIAVDGPFVVGHVAASPVTISDGTQGWVSLGPVSVEPKFQGRGIGSALVSRALDQLRESGVGGVVALGEPEFYRKFGFTQGERLVHPGFPAENFFARPIRDSRMPTGEVSYHPAFRQAAKNA